MSDPPPGSFNIIVYRLRDGRAVPFNHPDAVAERRQAIAKWKLSLEAQKRLDQRYRDTFDVGKPT